MDARIAALGGMVTLALLATPVLPEGSSAGPSAQAQATPPSATGTPEPLPDLAVADSASVGGSGSAPFDTRGSNSANRALGGLGVVADGPGVDVHRVASGTLVAVAAVCVAVASGVVVGATAVSVGVASDARVGGAAVNVGGRVWSGLGVPSASARTRGITSTPIASAPT